jgi:hypothetical protein
MQADQVRADSIFTRISTLDPAHTSLQVPITLPTWPDQERRQSEEDRKEVQHSTMPFNSRRRSQTQTQSL